MRVGLHPRGLPAALRASSAPPPLAPLEPLKINCCHTFPLGGRALEPLIPRGPPLDPLRHPPGLPRGPQGLAGLIFELAGSKNQVRG